MDKTKKQKEREELIDNKLLGFDDKIESDDGTLIINFEGTIEIGEYGIKGRTINQLIDDARTYETPKINVFDYLKSIDFE